MSDDQFNDWTRVWFNVGAALAQRERFPVGTLWCDHCGVYGQRGGCPKCGRRHVSERS